MVPWRCRMLNHRIINYLTPVVLALVLDKSSSFLPKSSFWATSFLSTFFISKSNVLEASISLQPFFPRGMQQESQVFHRVMTSFCCKQNMTKMKNPCNELKKQKKNCMTILESLWMSTSNPKTHVRPRRTIIENVFWTLFNISSRLSRVKLVVFLPQVNRCITNPKTTALTAKTKARINVWVK